MSNNVIILVAVLMVTAVGCQKKEEAAANRAPQVAARAAVTPDTAAAPAGDPHAGLPPREIPAGASHQGKVLQVMDAGSYSYLEVEEKGQKLWVAAMKTTAKKGDRVEFPNSPPMVNFESKTLKKTFASIYFADTLNILR